MDNHQRRSNPLSKKSCQKHYRRFFVRSRTCHNRRVNVEATGRNRGCQGWTAVKRQPALRAKRLGLRNDSSAFGRRAEERRWRARIPNVQARLRCVRRPKSGPNEIKLTRFNLIRLRLIALNLT
jgi:hypothetical protein